MKYTEGAFRAWGYEAAAEFGDSVILEKDATPDNSAGRVVIKDRIADAMFQEALLHPEQYSVLASPNLNGDYLSDALAAQVGGLGMAPASICRIPWRCSRPRTVRPPKRRAKISPTPAACSCPAR